MSDHGTQSLVTVRRGPLRFAITMLILSVLASITLAILLSVNASNDASQKDVEQIKRVVCNGTVVIPDDRRVLDSRAADRLVELCGKKGPTGKSGVAGVNGKDGPAGDQGKNGVRGSNGHDGADGSRGPRGLPGRRGPTGPSGPAGRPGKRGHHGAKGDMGASGLTREDVVEIVQSIAPPLVKDELCSILPAALKLPALCS